MIDTIIFKSSNGLFDIIIDKRCEELVFSHNKSWTVLFTKYRGRKYVTVPSCRSRITGVKIYLSRLVTDVLDETFSIYDIDHINGNRLDNRKENLRRILHRDNCRFAVRPSGSSKYRGVSWDTEKKKWVVRIRDSSGHKKHIGRYSDEVEAAKAYDTAARQIHKDFAVLNF